MSNWKKTGSGSWASYEKQPESSGWGWVVVAVIIGLIILANL